MRRRYALRLVGRCVVLILCVCLLAVKPDAFDVLRGNRFFHRFSLLHLLWAIWMIDLSVQIIPWGKNIPLGSEKWSLKRFIPDKEKLSPQAVKAHILQTGKLVRKVVLLWGVLIAVIGLMRRQQILHDVHLFLLTVVFYVCDLICVLIWCPFRLILKNKCCTTCRIFNWDHLMMFSPLIFVKGFYGWSLLAAAMAAWLVWELCVYFYPERFLAHTNTALRCSRCKDKLCTQWCDQ